MEPLRLPITEAGSRALSSESRLMLLEDNFD
jgi:hypothetical protein